jgi:hypothetical protein
VAAVRVRPAGDDVRAGDVREEDVEQGMGRRRAFLVALADGRSSGDLEVDVGPVEGGGLGDAQAPVGAERDRAAEVRGQLAEEVGEILRADEPGVAALLPEVVDPPVGSSGRRSNRSAHL